MRIAILFFAISFLSENIFASESEFCLQHMSSLDGFVRQQTQMLSDSQEESFEILLDSFTYKTNAEILLVITDDLCGYNPSDYCFELGLMLDVGQIEEDNGIVFMIQPSHDAAKVELFISVGYGLEEVIPEGAINKLNEQLIPLLEDGKYSDAISLGLNKLMAMSRVKYPDQIKQSEQVIEEEEEESLLETIFIWIGTVAFFIFAIVLFVIGAGSKLYGLKKSLTRKTGRYDHWFGVDVNTNNDNSSD